MKVHITTALFGGGNLSLELPEQDIVDGTVVTTAVYTDANTDSRKNSLHPRLKGKIHKMVEWLSVDADVYIWLDASFTIKSGRFITEVLRSLSGYDMCLFRHSVRSRIKDEFDFVTMSDSSYIRERYDGESMGKQVSIYLSDPTFVDENLFELGFFAYTKNLVKNKDYNVMTDWLIHNTLYSVQDQLSLPYLLHKHGVRYTTFDYNSIYDNPLVIFNKK